MSMEVKSEVNFAEYKFTEGKYFLYARINFRAGTYSLFNKDNDITFIFDDADPYSSLEVIRLMLGATHFCEKALRSVKGSATRLYEGGTITLGHDIRVQCALPEMTGN